VRSYAKYLKLHHACVIMNATVKRRTNNGKKFDKKAFEKEYKEKKEKEADKIEMVSKLAKRKKVPIKEALTNFDYQKTIDK
jgi:hypothetical protein